MEELFGGVKCLTQVYFSPPTGLVFQGFDTSIISAAKSEEAVGFSYALFPKPLLRAVISDRHMRLCIVSL